MSAGPEAPRVIAILGEPQVGKSSLINAILGETLLPTGGVGRPRSQTACACWLDDLPVTAGRAWRVEVDWLPQKQLCAALALSSTGVTSPRGLLFREGLEKGSEGDITSRLKALRLNQASFQLLQGLALGRDLRWLRLDGVCTRDEATRQLDPLTGGWAAALIAGVRLLGALPHRYAVVDLPGVGGYLDAGSEATLTWLTRRAPSVDAVVCVVGPNGLGEALSTLLLDHWLPTDLLTRLHIVTTYADRLVDDPDSAPQREAALSARRARALSQFTRLLGASAGAGDLASRIYCLDPRRPGRWSHAVEFEGELDRLRAALRSTRATGNSAAWPTDAAQT